MKKLLLLFLMLYPPPCYAISQGEIINKIKAEARRQQVNERVALSIAYIESTYNPVALNKEYNKGKLIGESLGLYQVRLSTAKGHCGIKSKAELLKPDNNIRCGISYLKYQIGRYHNLEKGILAYNAGSYRVRNGKPVNQDYLDRFNKAMGEL